jgi:hypothetical protein
VDTKNYLLKYPPSPFFKFSSKKKTAMSNEEHNHFIRPVFDLPTVWHSKLKDHYVAHSTTSTDDKDFYTPKVC